MFAGYCEAGRIFFGHVRWLLFGLFCGKVNLPHEYWGLFTHLINPPRYGAKNLILTEKVT